MPTLHVLSHQIIYQDQQYNSFPSMTRRADGHFLLAFRQATDRRGIYGYNLHVDTSSRAVFLESADGETWERTRTLYDHFLYGVQDPCLNVLRDGTLFATFFMWKVLEKEEAAEKLPEDRLLHDRWVGRLDHTYSIRSADGGLTWDEPVPLPYWPVQLRGKCTELDDGSIVAPLYGFVGERYQITIARTVDRGQSWHTLSRIESAADYEFDETCLYRTAAGKLMAFIRTSRRQPLPGEHPDNHPMFVAESLDDGRTWSEPVRSPISTPSPFEPFRLASGHVLLTYGFRFAPYGIRARLLDAECSDLEDSEEIVLRTDGLGYDLGYTSSMQSDDGRILIAYYYSDESGNRYIAGTWCEEVPIL